MRSLNELTLMTLKVSASSLSASSVSLRTLPIPRRRHSFAAPWTVRIIRAFKKVLPLEAPTFSIGLLIARKHPTRCSNILPEDPKKNAQSHTGALSFRRNPLDCCLSGMARLEASGLRTRLHQPLCDQEDGVLFIVIAVRQHASKMAHIVA